MIIYTDAFTGDELVSDTFNLKPSPISPILWECDVRKYSRPVGGDNFQLEGANPSAEDVEESGGGEVEMVMVHDIEDQFRLNWLKDEFRPSKEAFKSGLKGMSMHRLALIKTFLNPLNPAVGEGSIPRRISLTILFPAYLKRLQKYLVEIQTPEEHAAWKAAAPGALKALSANYDNYDFMVGESHSPDGQYVLIDFREDGVTPYAIIWKDGLKETKV
ncbi:unnamed protein product [Penicillium olsonii]|uniref:Translationally-controlled tumor protein homolog n=1 Tax=Penicillium olsonii TaxID=99116 RepID=A0A9W4HX04_PENOL|nr:unnamed protein product [Penicillium olsonii]CAG8135651.1 unnamed protein product [Penicillium olsonii]CAG8154566.1 unnamed protein product [Penicillium olsonii]